MSTCNCQALDQFLAAFKEALCMPEFPEPGGMLVRAGGATGGTSSVATSITAESTINTKGDYEELIASTEFDANWIEVELTGTSSALSKTLLDIAIGAASSEVVIIPDLFSTGKVNTAFGPYLFPVFIPRGTRIAARAQSSVISVSTKVSIRLISGSLLSGGRPCSLVSAYGDVTGSRGTSIDPGATADTDSSWVEIAGSTERDHHWLTIAFEGGDGAVNPAPTWRLQLGIGAASSEQVLIPDMHFSADFTLDVVVNAVRNFPIFIPEGTRIAAKARCDSDTSGDRDVHIKVYGAG